MAAHGRDDERSGAEGVDLVDAGGDDLGDAVDAAAAGGQCDAGTGLNGSTDLGPGKFRGDCGADIGDDGRFKLLTNPGPARKFTSIKDLQAHGSLQTFGASDD